MDMERETCWASRRRRSGNQPTGVPRRRLRPWWAPQQPSAWWAARPRHRVRMRRRDLDSGFKQTTDPSKAVWPVVRSSRPKPAGEG
jgi:hypothetical protein